MEMSHRCFLMPSSAVFLSVFGFRSGKSAWRRRSDSRVDGTRFDSSHDRGTPFKFTLGSEQVIEGLDKAVGTMKKGDIAIVIILPEYAFGSSESKQELGSGAAYFNSSS